VVAPLLAQRRQDRKQRVIALVLQRRAAGRGPLLAYARKLTLEPVKMTRRMRRLERQRTSAKRS
jgi:hypothetical protein